MIAIRENTSSNVTISNRKKLAERKKSILKKRINKANIYE